MDFKGCTNRGSGTRRIEAWVVDINEKPEQDRRLLCESTPFTWNRITYNSPTRCEPRVSIISSHVLCRDTHMLTELLAFRRLGRSSRYGIFLTQVVDFAGGVERDGR